MTKLPTTDAEIRARLNDAPLGTRELLRTGRIGTLVAHIDGEPVLRDQSGDFLTPEGESHRILRSWTGKKLFNTHQPISISQERVIELHPDYVYGLADGETLYSFVRARRGGVAPLAYDNVYISKNDTPVCQCGCSMYSFDHRDRELTKRIRDLLTELEAADDPQARFDELVAENSNRSMQRNLLLLVQALATDVFPHAAIALYKPVQEDREKGERLETKATEDEVKAIVDACREMLPRAIATNLKMSYRGCLCPRPRIVRRDGSFVHLVKNCKVGQIRRTTRRPELPESDDYFAHVAMHDRGTCAIDGKKIPKGSIEFLHREQKNKCTRVVAIRVDNFPKACEIQSAMIDKRFVKKNKEVKDRCLDKIMEAIDANLPIPEDVIAWRSHDVRAERKRKRIE